MRALFALRWRIGGILGWDRPGAGLGSRVRTLHERLPADLRETPMPHPSNDLPFRPLYITGDELAMEIANQTVHGVLHLGWVPDGAGGYRGQMAVLVKRNGLFGTVYLAAIDPFRHLIVYLQMMRDIERAWEAPAAQTRALSQNAPAARRVNRQMGTVPEIPWCSCRPSSISSRRCPRRAARPATRCS